LSEETLFHKSRIFSFCLSPEVHFQLVFDRQTFVLATIISQEQTESSTKYNHVTKNCFNQVNKKKQLVIILHFIWKKKDFNGFTQMEYF